MSHTDQLFGAERFVHKDSRYLGRAPWVHQPLSAMNVQEGRSGRHTSRNSSALSLGRKASSVLVVGVLLIMARFSIPVQAPISTATSVLSEILCDYHDISGLYFRLMAAAACKILLNPPISSFRISYPSFDGRVLFSSKFTPNYASNGNGASIIKQLTSPTHNLPPPSWLTRLRSFTFGLELNRPDINRPHVILEDNLVEGECWEFTGSYGQVGIRLSRPISVSQCVFDSPSPSTLSLSSFSRTPLNMSVWAFINEPGELMGHSVTGTTSPPERAGKQKTLLTRVDYQPSAGNTRQYFRSVDSPFQTTDEIMLEVHKNHGGGTTCIYWIGIYGTEP
ncbi:hypothetical protein CPB83DRAFT_900923 [Crepidotus variabilis]|uniref:SUN domain-containing protein n=1 Tax=Crepidotus variabilis TaxID=179855 RepID=A0A9P6BBU4_9AGAR|nr:hypothetical protein CPB83DRAFT_900923 [Crepidotus variabilis]